MIDNRSGFLVAGFKSEIRVRGEWVSRGIQCGGFAGGVRLVYQVDTPKLAEKNLAPHLEKSGKGPAFGVDLVYKLVNNLFPNPPNLT